MAVTNKPTLAQWQAAASEDQPTMAATPSTAHPWYRQADYLVIACFVVGALLVTSRLWILGEHGLLREHPADHRFFMWVLSHAAYSLTHLDNPLFTERLNAPFGVNMMANTAVLVIGIPLVPITLLFGPHVSFALFDVLALTGTATAWYFFLSRKLVTSRLAAAIGAGFCGFAPGMIAHSAGQPNIVAQFLVPLIIWQVVGLAEPGKTLRRGLTLGALAIVQVFLNEEILFFTALACVIGVAVYTALRWREARAQAGRFVLGLGIATGLAGVMLAYPLWFQFFGPQHYRGLPFAPQSYVADLATYPGYATEALAGNLSSAERLTVATEQNAFFGWPLLVLIVIIVIALRRELFVLIAAVIGLVFALLSLGPTITINGHSTGVPGPMTLLDTLPLFDLTSVTRFALGVIPCVAILLAIATDRVMTISQQGRARTRMRPLWYLLLAVALIPLAPTPLPVSDRSPAPPFITSGQWRNYLSGDQTLLVVDPKTWNTTGMHWSAQARLEFPLANGYFLGPSGHSDQAIWGSPLRPTTALLYDVAYTGRVPQISAAERQQAQRDLRYWQVGLVALPPQQHFAAVQATLTALLGRGESHGKIWIWPIAKN